jgi:hypothetical protein
VAIRIEGDMTIDLDGSFGGIEHQNIGDQGE